MVVVGAGEMDVIIFRDTRARLDMRYFVVQAVECVGLGNRSFRRTMRLAPNARLQLLAVVACLALPCLPEEGPRHTGVSVLFLFLVCSSGSAVLLASRAKLTQQPSPAGQNRGEEICISRHRVRFARGGGHLYRRVAFRGLDVGHESSSVDVVHAIWQIELACPPFSLSGGCPATRWLHTGSHQGAACS